MNKANKKKAKTNEPETEAVKLTDNELKNQLDLYLKIAEEENKQKQKEEDIIKAFKAENNVLLDKLKAFKESQDKEGMYNFAKETVRKII
jgi:cell division GTPase FtsZ